MNLINPDIQFTMTHTSIPGEDKEFRCDCPTRDSIPFLDTSVRIKNKKIEFDLNRKSTDKNMYLLPNSCHSPACHTNIPFSLALCITRICSTSTSREIRYKELKELLISNKSQAIKEAVNTKKSRRPVVSISWDLRLPLMDALTKKHCTITFRRRRDANSISVLSHT